MKTLLFKLFAVTVIVAGASNYLIYLKTGRMPLREWVADIKNMRAPSVRDLSATDLINSDLIDKARDAAPIGDKKVKIYMWKDENGQVHYSNQEDKAPKGAQEKQVSTNINTLPVVKPRAETEPSQASNAEAPDMDEQLRRLREAKRTQFESQLE